MSKLCVDCKHFKTNNSYMSKNMNIKHGFCRHPNGKIVDVVSGQVTYPEVREIRYFGECRKDGLLYEKVNNPFEKIINTNQVHTSNWFFGVFIFVFVLFIKESV